MKFERRGQRVMKEFRWIQISFLLTALPQFTEAYTEKPLTAKYGGDVTLPCENSRKPQNNCGNTTWDFYPSGKRPVELIKRGKIKEDIGVKKNRLRLTEDCSLVINNVQEEDAGHYDCLQHISGIRYLRESYFLLSVSEEMAETTTALTPLTKISYSTASQSNSTSTAENDASNVKGETTGPATTEPVTAERVTTAEISTTATTHEAPTPNNRSARPLDVFMLTLRVFEVLLLTVITVLLFRAQVNRGSSAGNTECDGDDCTEIYENDGESSASARFHRSSS